ncbi:hypothetical protein GWI33_016313 [Rhynchophorus ferrugineus]|uniref:Uncharacterized protein n=1 Tax=Rhynchophorus ferrugineus TaxID=354439 RepID=A0A834M3G0_RHYFE|nr:hypothetical protein GWI33_016313 [Rhynchophorus ferrugineus]
MADICRLRPNANDLVFTSCFNRCQRRKQDSPASATSLGPLTCHRPSPATCITPNNPGKSTRTASPSCREDVSGADVRRAGVAGDSGGVRFALELSKGSMF